MISYLKLVNNPDDSIALQRVINTPARGIGKTTMETLERLALETGSLAVGDHRPRRARSSFLPARSLRSKGFKEIIDEARAMLLRQLRRETGGEHCAYSAACHGVRSAKNLRSTTAGRIRQHQLRFRLARGIDTDGEPERGDPDGSGNITRAK